MANPFFDTPRTRRLKRDLEEMKALQAKSSILKFEAAGDAPERYEITFNGKGLNPEGGIIKTHKLDVSLGMEYPRSIPAVRWQTPIHHPNISGGTPCFGTFLMNPNVRLVDIVEILWDMARLATYNPYGGYGDKDIWQTLRKKHDFPVDKRILRNKEPIVEAPASEGGEDDIDLIIMGASMAGLPPSQQWVKKAVEQYLESRELDFGAEVYTQDEWRATGNKYGEEAIATITTEGPLGHLLNYPSPETVELLEDWDDFLKKLGLWWELGYAWSVHLYPFPKDR